MSKTSIDNFLTVAQPGMSQISPWEVDKIRKFIAEGLSNTEIAIKFNNNNQQGQELRQENEDGE